MFGWIDGQLGKRDDATWTVRFTPRRLEQSIDMLARRETICPVRSRS